MSGRSGCYAHVAMRSTLALDPVDLRRAAAVRKAARPSKHRRTRLEELGAESEGRGGRLLVVYGAAVISTPSVEHPWQPDLQAFGVLWVELDQQSVFKAKDAHRLLGQLEDETATPQIPAFDAPLERGQIRQRCRICRPTAAGRIDRWTPNPLGRSAGLTAPRGEREACRGRFSARWPDAARPRS